MNESMQYTKVETYTLPKPITAEDGFVMLGSCFAQYMAERLQLSGHEVMVNPLGTLFNPFSIAQTVEAALKVDVIDLPVFQTDDEWRCWWANTKLKADKRGALEQLVKDRLQELRTALLQSKHLVITLGTNVCYRLGDGLIVTNCQRQPDRLFTEWRASVGEVTDCLDIMVESLLQVNADLQIIFTVSPYRYKKYGYHGSQLSKATLLLAEDEVIKRHPGSCCYFPAYEILLDELRNYDFYAPDGLHPAPEAVDHIWESFQYLIK